MAYMQGSAGAQNSQLGGPGRVPILPCLLARCFSVYCKVQLLRAFNYKHCTAWYKEVTTKNH